MKRYYWYLPGSPYAFGPTLAKSPREAKADFRAWLGVSRLPKGAKVWMA